jgi:hypothetical protein
MNIIRTAAAAALSLFIVAGVANAAMAPAGKVAHKPLHVTKAATTSKMKLKMKMKHPAAPVVTVACKKDDKSCPAPMDATVKPATTTTKVVKPAK